MNIRVPVVVRLSEKRMRLKTITDMKIGTIIEFDKNSEEELELMIRDKVIGFGLAVKVGEKFGLRISSMCDIRETIAALGGQ